jgi:hypothetical protein
MSIFLIYKGVYNMPRWLFILGPLEFTMLSVWMVYISRTKKRRDKMIIRYGEKDAAKAIRRSRILSTVCLIASTILFIAMPLEHY